MKRIFLLFGLVLCWACEEENLIDPQPEIELISIGPELVREFEDSVRIRVFYKDGDGDLGGGHPDSNNVFVVDNRAGIVNAYRLQSLVPDQTQVPIQGEVDILINSLFIADSSTQEEVSFSLYMVDQAGHESNRITTRSLTIYRP